MRIAVIGTGIAGNVAAYHLNAGHDVTVYEQNSHIGGHSHSHSVFDQEQQLQIDTGFIVLNDRTYPQFNALLTDLDVATQETEMSFSVKCERSGLEYNGNNLNTLFAQRSNLLRPAFHRMIRDILRFNREAQQYLLNAVDDFSLGHYLRQGKFSRPFIEQYIVPMGAAIWSAEPTQMFEFPARFFLRFFANHGLLSINDRPQWSVIKGGSKSYVEELVAGFKDRIRLNCAVKELRRYQNRVDIISDEYGLESYDYVFIASHSNQALALLDRPTTLEKAVLSAIPYQRNEAVLHTDERLLPARKLAWAAWNYHIPKATQECVALSYNMNILQRLEAAKTYCVTLNYSDRIDEKKIIKMVSYDHPVFTPEGIEAQSRHREVNGTKRTYYCGAYWGNGFHEDGVVSALTALQHFDQDRCQHSENNAQQYLHRAG